MMLGICLALVILAGQAAGGSLKDVPPGGTVFIGEQGLDLTGIPSGTVLFWYSESDIVGRSAPSATVLVENNANFYVAPSDFVRHTGNWYIGDSRQVGVIVNDPTQSIAVYDQRTLRDMTNKSVPSGDFLTFRIETNMDVISSQRTFDEGFMTIRVRSPDGTMYTQLYQDNETLVNLADLTPDAMPWYWIPLEKNSSEGWKTNYKGVEGNIVYRAGLYSFWTESNLNGIKDNYKNGSGNDFAGRTTSVVHTINIVSGSLSVVVNNESVIRGKPFTVTITGNPDSTCYLWVRDTSSMSGYEGDQPPTLTFSQDGVTMDPAKGPWPIGQYVPRGLSKTIQQDVTQHDGRGNVHGVAYYASVNLSSTGNRTVGFLTTPGTKDQKYTIRAERPEPYDPPASNTGPDRAFKTGTADIWIEKGSLQVSPQMPVVRESRTFYLGEEVTLTGTNSQTEFTYLFITGPNLPAGGGAMTDPERPVSWDDPDSFAYAEVIDEEWEYVWETARLNIDPGAYTVYAVSDPVNKSRLADYGGCDPDDPDCYSGPLYTTLSIILNNPFISVRASPSVVASGDELAIRGIAAGQPENGVGVWIFGRNYISYQAPGVNPDGTFDLELSKGQTRAMAAGQYFVVAQHPMYNEIFDVWPTSSVAGFNNQDIVAGSYPVPGNTLFRIQGEGSLQGPDGADALVQALNNPGVDDIYAKLQFLVETPTITIYPAEGVQVGDNITLAGTTNMAVGDTVLVEVTSSSFSPTTKMQSSRFSGTSGTVTVCKGADDLNRWSFPINTSSFLPDEYIVRVSGITVNAQASTLINVALFNPATHRPVTLSEEKVNESGTSITAITPDDTTMGDENNSEDSGNITIGAKTSRLAHLIGSRPATARITEVTTAPVDSTGTVLPQVVMDPATRPTIQPGLGALITLIGLGVAAFHARTGNRR